MPTVLPLPSRLCVTRPSWAGSSPKVAPNLRAYRQPRSLPNISEHDELARGDADGPRPWPRLAAPAGVSSAAPARPRLRRADPLPSPSPWPPSPSLEGECLASLTALKEALEQDWPEVPLGTPEVVDTLQALAQLQMWCRYQGGEPPFVADIELARVQLAGWQWARGRDFLRRERQRLSDLLVATLEGRVVRPVAEWVAELALEQVDRLLDGARAPASAAGDEHPLWDVVEQKLVAVVARAGLHGRGTARDAKADAAALRPFFCLARSHSAFPRLARLLGDIEGQGHGAAND